MTADDWTPPGWRVKEGEPNPENGWRSVRLECRAEGCAHLFYSGLPKSADASGFLESRAVKDHQDQHRPDRALDIEVAWIVSACCSVCEDEIGKVEEDSDGLVCRECGTMWDRDGTSGEREEGR